MSQSSESRGPNSKVFSTLLNNLIFLKNAILKLHQLDSILPGNMLFQSIHRDLKDLIQNICQN